AVWCTVGYFEVVDETVRPVKLGSEVGRSENRHIRHRFFSVIDRSGLQLFNTSSLNAVAGTTSPWVSTQPYAVNNTVIFNCIHYQCIQPNANQRPDISPAAWSRVTMTLNGQFQTVNP